MKSYTATLFKQYLRTPYTYIAFLLPILFIVGLGKIIPAGLVIPSAITIGITISILFLFGGTVQEMRSTSFIKSISLTKLSKWTIVLINMFVAAVISVVAVGVILTFSFILDSVSFFAEDFSAFSPDTAILKVLNSTIIWRDIEWITFAYAVMLTAILSFAVSYLIISFTKTTNSLYVVSFIYVFVMILMGGILIPGILSVLTGSFVQYLNVWVPHYYTNQLMSASMVTDNVILGEFIDNANNSVVMGELLHFLGGIPGIDDWNWAAISNDVNTINGFLNSSYDPTSWDDFCTYLGTTNPEDAFDSNLFRFLTTDLYTLGGDKLLDLVQDISGLPPLVTKPFASDLSLLQILCFNTILSPIAPFPVMDLGTFNGIMTLLANNSDVIVQYTHSVTTWDFNSYESVANSFMPLILADIFATIGIYNFKWTIK